MYSYRETIRVLSNHFTVYAVELPGQGYTAMRQGDFAYDLDAMSAALESFIEAIGQPHVALVGHSWGGSVALYFAEVHPDKVATLVLIASPAFDIPSSWNFRALEFPLVGEMIGKLMTRSSFERVLRRAFSHQERVTSRAIDEYWAALSRRENRRAMWLQQRTFDYSSTQARLDQVRMPTLILWGSEDAFDPPWQAAELGRRIDGATVRVLSNCGHNVHEDCPDQANAMMAQYLLGSMAESQSPP